VPDLSTDYVADDPRSHITAHNQTNTEVNSVRGRVAALEAPPALAGDMRVSIVTAKTGSNNPTLTTFRGGLQGYQFSASQMNEVFLDVQMPTAWAAGTPVVPSGHWSPGSSTNTGTVRWQLEYSWANPVTAPGNTFPDSSLLPAADQAATGVAWSHQVTELGTIDGTGMRPGSILVCRLARLGNATEDTFTGACFGLAINFHIQVAT
jgi:hypothetical protein